MLRGACRSIVAALLGVATAASSLAHEGDAGGDPSAALALAAAGAPDRPHRLADGSLWVPKPMQRLLGLRTEVAGRQAHPVALELTGEIGPQPAAAVALTAPQAGRVEPGDAGWPVIGQTVAAGAVLAWLRPVLALRDRARRQGRIADLDQKIAIAQLNVDRIGLQTEASQGQVAAGNIYMEQAQTELSALQRQRQLLSAALGERLPIRAERAGRVTALAVRPGQPVDLGQPLFEVLDPRELRVTVTSFDPALGPRLRQPRLIGEGVAAGLPLRYRSTEPLADRPGWQHAFDLSAPAETALPLLPGRVVHLQAETLGDGGVELDPAACVRDAAGRARVWTHVAAERFQAVAVDRCENAGSKLDAEARVVVRGAALLGQYL